MATLREREIKQAKRNMNPHAEAVAAMRFWSHEYAYEQRGGSMDFWDALPEWKRNVCREAVDKIVAAKRERRRATASKEEPHAHNQS